MTTELTASELTPASIDGRGVRRFCLQSDALRVELMEYGATVLAVHLREPDGREHCVSRGLAKPEDYAKNTAYMGSVCGRYAGRVTSASYPAPGSTAFGGESAEIIRLSANEGEHHLHGGVKGFTSRHFSGSLIESADRVGVEFAYLSPDGEEGYPGALDTRIRYWVDQASRLWIEYSAQALDTVTPVSLTSHCYWNLSDDPRILDHELQLAARRYLELDANLLPTGGTQETRSTALDFSEVRSFGDAFAALPEGSEGLDHCLLDFQTLGAKQELDIPPQIARICDPSSGRSMRVYTDQPIIVLYTGNALDGSKDHGGHQRHSGFCIECQQFPDAPNHAEFPSTFVDKGEFYRQCTVYEFSH